MNGVVLMVLIFYVSCGVNSHNMTITVLESAVAKGAVCLDGSPPSYAYSPGFGDGAHNWHVHLHGGAWCESSYNCFQRSTSDLGSSTDLLNHTNGNFQARGMLDNNATFNPDFYNWNVVAVFYCDGSSFMSDVPDIDPEYNITYRGARIYDAVMEDLLTQKGMRNAQNALLSGSSAGGLATILKCDKFRALFLNSSNTRVKCISDSGFFIHGEDIIGAEWREAKFSSVISTHGLTNLLPKSCTSKFSSKLCLFPENLVKDVQTPLFLIESAFDQYQISENVFSPNSKSQSWINCTTNLMSCNSTENQIMKDFGREFIKTLLNTIDDRSSRRGYFVHSCYLHVHIHSKGYFTCSSLVGNNVLSNKTVAQAVSDWYFDRSNFQEIDTHNDLPRNCTHTLGSDFQRKCIEVVHPKRSKRRDEL